MYYDIIYIIIYIILIYNILLILSSPPHLLLQLVTSHFADVMHVMHVMHVMPAHKVILSLLYIRKEACITASLLLNYLKSKLINLNLKIFIYDFAKV